MAFPISTRISLLVSLSSYLSPLISLLVSLYSYLSTRISLLVSLSSRTIARLTQRQKIGRKLYKICMMYLVILIFIQYIICSKSSIVCGFQYVIHCMQYVVHSMHTIHAMYYSNKPSATCYMIYYFTYCIPYLTPHQYMYDAYMIYVYHVSCTSY